MGYDIQRAALVTCCLSALLLAASLMPAAGLGSFPSVGDPPDVDAGQQPASDGSGPSGPPDTTPLEPTPADSTPSESDERTDEPTPTERADGESGPDRTTTTPGGQADDDDSSLLAVGSLASLVAVALGCFVALGGVYTGGVLVVGSVFGYEAVEWLPFSATVRSIPQLTMSSLIGTAAATGSFLGQLRSVASALGDGVATLARVPAEFGRVLWLAIIGPFRALASVSLSLGAGLGSLFGAASTLSLGFGRGREAETATEDARETAAPDPETGDEEPPPLPTSVGEAFDRMTDRLSARNEDAMTPAELAEYAIQQGWPSTPVETLTGAFREVRYGGYEETSEETERAVSAFERLREFWRRSG